jgi:geranylgeranyl pyrophosphate synthase
MASASSRHLLNSQLFFLAQEGTEGAEAPLPSYAVDAAAALELLHLFMLVQVGLSPGSLSLPAHVTSGRCMGLSPAAQDDVMDNALMRRGEITVHRRLCNTLMTRHDLAVSQSPRGLANSLAVVVSDCLHASASELLAQSAMAAVQAGHHQAGAAVGHFHHTAMLAARYQYQDMLGWRRAATKAAEVAQAVEELTVVATALRFHAPLKLGACFGETPLPPEALVWGTHIGTAFKVSQCTL